MCSPSSSVKGSVQRGAGIAIKTPDNTASGIIQALKPLHHINVDVQGGANPFAYINSINEELVYI